jgi:pSer/pThr/pTyr-binding forkhead associated (FHA) protein
MIGDSAVSRKHCTITQVSPDVYEISDLEGHHETFVNGIQISRTPIRHRDRIRVGTSEFVFLTGEDKGKDGGGQ